MNLDIDAAVERAASKLSRSDKLAGEIAHDLATKGFPSEVIETTLERLRRAGVLDDRRVIRQRVSVAIQKGNASRAGLTAKLESQGADPFDAQTALNELFPSELEPQLIRNILKKKYHQTEQLQKAGRYLASLGFDPSLIESELSRYFESDAL